MSQKSTDPYEPELALHPSILPNGAKTLTQRHPPEDLQVLCGSGLTSRPFAKELSKNP
jgi:hypothetical protein